MNKESSYLVETIFQRAFSKKDKEGELLKGVEVQTHTLRFTGENREATKRNAERKMDEIIRYGLKMGGGSVLKSVIHPSAILQVGLIDENLYDEEVAGGMESTIEAVTPATPADV